MSYIVLGHLNKWLGSSTKKKGDNYAFSCPFCKHRKQKLEVDVKSGLWNCWNCNTRGNSASSLLYKAGVPYSEIADVKKNESYTTKTVSHYTDDVHYPEFFDYLPTTPKTNHQKNLLEYLYKRGITKEDIIKYKIGYYTEKYITTVVLPSYDRYANLNYYINKNVDSGKYLNPPYPKNQIIYDLFINWREDLILVEGNFDAIAVKRNATPLLGKTLSYKLKKAISESSLTNVFICLDGGEIDSIVKISEYVRDVGKTPLLVPLPLGEDPSSLGYEKVWKYIEKSVVIDDDFILKNRLNVKSIRDKY